MLNKKRHRINIIIVSVLSVLLLLNALWVLGLFNFENSFDLYFTKNKTVADLVVNSETKCLRVKIKDYDSPFSLIFEDENGIELNQLDYLEGDFKARRGSCFLPPSARGKVRVTYITDDSANVVQVEIFETSYCDN